MNLKEFIKTKIISIHSKSGYEYKYTYWKKHFTNELNEILYLTSFLDEYYSKIPLKQRIWHILNNKLELQYCPICKKNLLKWHNSLQSYAQTCSSKCTKQLKSYKEKIKQTNLKKYGVEYSWQIKEVKEKIKQTNLKKYGVEYFTQTKNFKEILSKNNPMSLDKNKEKIKQTNLKKYGVEYPLQNKKIKEKIKQTNLKKYGVEYPLQNKKIKEKIKQTNLKKYGVENFSQKHIKNYNEYVLLTREKIIEQFVDENGLFKNKEFQQYFGISYSYLQKLKKQFNLDEYPNKFTLEFELFNWMPTQNKKRNNRTQIKPYELDIFIPDKNLAIEFNGIFWHSIKFKNKTYHQEKSLKCLDKNIKLLQIFETEWLDNTKRRIWKSLILYNLGLLKKRYFARNLIIKEISSKETRDFLEANHLQGYIPAKINIGLFDDKNELISLMTFSKPRFNKNIEWELIRFVSKKYSVCIGCASKLFKYFIQKYNPNSILSYANLRWSNGNIYNVLGFKFHSITNPNYFYVNEFGKIIGSRIKFQKYKLKNILNNYDKKKTEIENMVENGYYPIFDAGNMKFIFK